MKSTFSSDSHPSLQFHETKLCRLLYEDSDVYVIDKQSGVLTTPTEKNESQTALGALARYGSKKHRSKIDPIPVQRLDRDTSGILVVAKHQNAADKLMVQFKERKPLREYIAVVAGVLQEDRGTYEDRVFVDKFFNQKIARKGRIGQLAILHFEVDTRFANATLCRITLETGRKNQIRAQFAERKHPVLGDQRYEKEKAKHPLWPYKRLALHAHTLEFVHPTSEKVMRFSARLPAEFQKFFEKISQ